MKSTHKGIRTLACGYKEKGKTAPISTPSNQQLAVHYARAINRSGGAIDVGIMKKLSSGRWKIYGLVGGVASDLTSAIQAGTASTIFTTTNNDGFLVAADVFFGLFGLTVSQAENGVPVYTYKYFNGTSFTTLTTIESVTAYSAADQFNVFYPPLDWAKGSGVAGTDSSKYYIQVLATTAPGQAVKVTNAWAAQPLKLSPQLANNADLVFDVSQERPIPFEQGESLIPYFGGSANAANIFEARYVFLD